jgi:L-seryl-tRNA(Ser) seleniumtransferase
MNSDQPSDAWQTALRSLPSVDHLLKQPAVASLLEEHPRGEVVQAIRVVLDERRAAIRAGQAPSTDVASFALDIRQKLYQRSVPHLRRVVNATGIVLHTGLGRAPLAPEAVEAVAEVAAGYCNLELDLETGERGDRHAHVRELLRELTGAEDGLVVNNNAAATYLALNTLAAEHDAVISRGQLVEIGGSYRMPDIMAAARCRMVEVGTTNRTRISDYERVIGEHTAVLLRVHTSNYRIQGFVESPSLEELVALARQHNLVVLDDLGSGLIDERLPQISAAGKGADESVAPGETVAEAGAALEASSSTLDTPRSASVGAAPTGAGDAPWLPRGLEASRPSWDEPSVRHSVAAGADLTLFSGDKLLGGPQAGVIVGRADLIARLRKNPLMRTFRPDKMTLAALEATLRLYRDPESLCRRLPVLRMLTVRPEELEVRARAMAERLGAVLPTASVRCQTAESLAGGGSLPLTPFKTWVVVVQTPELRSATLAAALRNRSVPIICRVHEEALVFDCRTLGDEDGEQIAGALPEVMRELSGG